MLNERGDAASLSGADQRANFFELVIVKRDGDFCGRHTECHTIAGADSGPAAG